MRERSAEIAAMASRNTSGDTARSSSIALGVAHGADVDAEALVHAGIVPKGELGAAAAGVEHDERARVQAQTGLGGQ